MDAPTDNCASNPSLYDYDGWGNLEPGMIAAGLAVPRTDLAQPEFSHTPAASSQPSYNTGWYSDVQQHNAQGYYMTSPFIILTI